MTATPCAAALAPPLSRTTLGTPLDAPPPLAAYRLRCFSQQPQSMLPVAKASQEGVSSGMQARS